MTTNHFLEGGGWGGCLRLREKEKKEERESVEGGSGSQDPAW